MSGLIAGTQYGDNRGTVSITWHGSLKLGAFAKRLGVPDDELAIGIRVSRGFAINRMDPEDRRFKASTYVSVFTVSKAKLRSATPAEYFKSTDPELLQIKSYVKSFGSADEILDFFKDIDIVALDPGLAELDLEGVQISEEIDLD